MIEELTQKIKQQGAIETTVELLKKAGLSDFEAELLVAKLLEECKDFKYPEEKQ